ncbi:MAG TPA: hypothetical protein VKU85_01890 [bacterium]|nr:hypothetical protein [bacterium]
MAAEKLGLTEADRERIRAEEIFRQEVRHQLSPPSPPSKWGRIAGGLNRPFTLWFLSSIVVAGLSLLYTQWEEGREERERTTAEIARLDIELNERIVRCMRRLESAERGVGLREAWGRLNEDSALFPQYRDRTFDSLLFALKALVPQEEKGTIDQVRRAYGDLDALVNGTVADEVPATIRRLGEELRGSFAVRGWGE